MPVFKNESNGTWYVMARYVNWKGERKQKYCYRRCLNQDVVVQGNPRIFKALKTELATVLTELKRIEAGNGVDEELLNVIELIAVIMGGLKGEDEDGK